MDPGRSSKPTKLIKLPHGMKRIRRPIDYRVCGSVSYDEAIASCSFVADLPTSMTLLIIFHYFPSDNLLSAQRTAVRLLHSLPR